MTTTPAKPIAAKKSPHRDPATILFEVAGLQAAIRAATYAVEGSVAKLEDAHTVLTVLPDMLSARIEELHDIQSHADIFPNGASAS